MGFSSRELLLILRARDEGSRVVRSFATSFGAVDAAAMRAARNQIALGSAMVSVGTAIGGVGAAGIAWMKGATDRAVEFNRQVAYTATQLDGVAASHKQLAAAVKRTGNDIAVPIDEMNAGLYDIFSSMNVNLPQAERLLRSFSKEAVAGQVELREASRSTIGILNAFHLKVEDVTRVQDVQFQLVRKGIGTYEEFAKVMGRATPSAARAGQTVEVLSGMLAYLTRNGLSAAMAAASAGRAFDAFSHPKTVEHLKDLGVQAKNARGEFRPFTDVMVDLQKALEDMSAPERAAALYELFKGSGGTIQARRFYDMVTKDAASVKQFTGLVKDMQNAGGAFESAYRRMADTTASKSQLLANQWDILKINIGEALIPVLEFLMGVLQRVLTWWNSLSEGTRKTIVVILAIGAALSVLVGLLVILAGTFLMLSGAAAAAGLKVGAVLLVFTGIGAALAALAVAGFLIVKNWDAISKALINAWNAVWNTLKPIVDWIWSEIGSKLVALWQTVSTSIVNAVVAVRDWVVRVWTEIVQWTATVWPMIKQLIQPIIDWLVSVWGPVKDFISAVLQALLDTFRAVWTAISGVIKGAWVLISNVVEGIIQVFKGIIQFIVAIFTGQWRKAWDGIWMVIQGIWLIIKGFIFGIWEAIKGIVKGALQFIGTIISNGLKAAWAVIVAILNTIKAIWNTVWTWAAGFVKGLWDSIVRAARNFATLIRDAFVNAVNWVKEVWGKIVDVAKKPVNFVIEFVYNRGIRWVWNKVADFLGLGGLPEAKLLAGGGPVSGPGGPRDDLIPAITSGGNFLRLSNGEYVMPADKTAQFYPMLEAMRKGQVPGFAEGGLIGKIIDFIGGAAGEVVKAVSDPIGYITSKLGTAGKWIEVVAKLPFKILAKVGKWLWDKITKFLDVAINGNIDQLSSDAKVKALQMWALKQKGKTYQWGAVGPEHYDCSGLVGNAWAAINGKPVYQRYMTTASMGVGKYGMKNGRGIITVYLGNGHTAMNIGGLHAEAYGGNGTPLAIGRIGTPLSYYHTTMHMMRDGGIISMKNHPSLLMQSFLKRGWPEPVPVASYDRGGVWPSGTFGWNGSGHDEYVYPGHSGGPPPKAVNQNFYITTQEIDPRKHAADLGWEIAHGGPAV